MLFYFDLNNGNGLDLDRKGTELRSDATAHELAVVIACELIRDNDIRTRHWKIRVRDARHRTVSEVQFASVADNLAYFRDAISIGTRKP